MFIYNANKNRFDGNWFEGCGIGIHFTAGSERNEITGNAFIGNRNQVKYVGTRYLDWSDERPRQLLERQPGLRPRTATASPTPPTARTTSSTRCIWTCPPAKLLLNSPAVQVVRWAQAQFPALYPGGVVDSAPADGARRGAGPAIGRRAGRDRRRRSSCTASSSATARSRPCDGV